MPGQDGSHTIIVRAVLRASKRAPPVVAKIIDLAGWSETAESCLNVWPQSGKVEHHEDSSELPRVWVSGVHIRLQGLLQLRRQILQERRDRLGRILICEQNR